MVSPGYQKPRVSGGHAAQSGWAMRSTAASKLEMSSSHTRPVSQRGSLLFRPWYFAASLVKIDLGWRGMEGKEGGTSQPQEG